jgi:hypothetical protein
MNECYDAVDDGKTYLLDVVSSLVFMNFLFLTYLIRLVPCSDLCNVNYLQIWFLRVSFGLPATRMNGGSIPYGQDARISFEINQNFLHSSDPIGACAMTCTSNVRQFPLAPP